jgi:hypothetical protein
MSTPVQRAARGIMLLINNRPESPRLDEVEAIIEMTVERAVRTAPQGGFVPTITGIAAELPALYDLREAMSDGDCRQTLREDGLHGVPVASRPKLHAFEILKDQAHAQAEAMESLMFLLEPQSADEALSMLLLADSAFQAFAGEAYGNQELPAAEEELWKNVTRALHALVRWLHRTGAASPLLAEHFNENNLQSPSERSAEALVAAKELKAWHKADALGDELEDRGEAVQPCASHGEAPQ